MRTACSERLLDGPRLPGEIEDPTRTREATEVFATLSATNHRSYQG